MNFRMSTLPGGDTEKLAFFLDRERLDPNTGIKLLRVVKGWRQADLAEVMGVSSEIVRKWESGRYPVPEMAMKLFDYVLWDNSTHPSHTDIGEAVQNLGIK